MRTIIAMLLLLASAACGVQPGQPMLTGANEMTDRPGLFSGPTGDFLLLGSDAPPQDRSPGPVDAP